MTIVDGQTRHDFELGPIQLVGGVSNGFLTIRGYGLWWKDRSKHRLYFSERNWINPFHFAVGTYHFKFLRRRYIPGVGYSA